MATAKKTSSNPTKQQKAKALTQAQKVKAAAKAVEDARLSAQDMEVTSVGDWKASRHQGEGVKLRLPSGNVCLARNPGMEVFIEQGMIPNSLMPIVMAAVQQGQGLSPKETEKLAEDPAILTDITEFANRVLVQSVIQPPVQLPPLWTAEDAAEGYCAAGDVGRVNQNRKDDELLYADDVDLEDRLFILQWAVGGTRDLERFRQQSANAVEGLANVETVEGEAE